MADIIVKYNGSGLSPTPLVGRSYEFIDFGGRWGQAEQITLSSVISGYSSAQGAILAITQLFTGQFKTLEVYDGASLLYTWPNVCLQELSIPTTNFYSNAVAKYDVKLVSYQVPSGVIEPSNEYSFVQNTDGIVGVTHKISARGVRTSNGALDNAINFVKLFTNKNPYNFCAPAFIPNGSGILQSVSENIDRATCSYSVVENYKFITGSLLPYIETSTLSINEARQNDYVTMDLGIKWQGSPVNNNISALKSNAQSLSLKSSLQSFGIKTDNVYQNDFSINIDSGSSSLDIKASFISGSDSDLSGYFDYAIEMDTDLLLGLTSWKIEGEFKSRGPISYRKTQINTFKSANQAAGYVPYLINLISSSQLYANYGTGYILNPSPKQLNLVENSGIATLKLSATFGDDYIFSKFQKSNYSIEVEPSRWIYELMPSASIEGHFVVQDLQMKNQSKVKFDINASYTGVNTTIFQDLYGLSSLLYKTYLTTGFETSENTTSGIADVSLSQSYIGTEKMAPALLNSKIYGSISSDYFRQPGFKFGY